MVNKNLPGPAGFLKGGEGVSAGLKPSYICARCSQTFKWYKGVRVVRPGIGLCPEHNPKFKRDEFLMADPPEEPAPGPESATPCNTTK